MHIVKNIETGVETLFADLANVEHFFALGASRIAHEVRELVEPTPVVEAPAPVVETPVVEVPVTEVVNG